MRWLRLLFALGLGACLGAAAVLVVQHAVRGSGDLRDVQWALLGSGSDGHSLVVQPVGPFGSCDQQPYVEVTEHDFGAINLRMRNRLNCPDGIDLLMDRSFAPITVQVGRLTAQSVGGLNMVAPRQMPDGRYPSVVGLSVGLARTILDVNGTQARLISGPDGLTASGPSPTSVSGDDIDIYQVVKQTPAAGARRIQTGAARVGTLAEAELLADYVKH